MSRLPKEVTEFIYEQIKKPKRPSYERIKTLIRARYRISVSKATISKRAQGIHLRFRRGRKRLIAPGKRPSRSLFLDCAGAFFLKGAELELGLLGAINRLLATSIESIQARKVLKLAQQINALMLYGPVFGFNRPGDISHYSRRGLLHLSGQKSLPHHEEISQYLQFLTEQKMLVFVIKEVAKACSGALYLRIDSDSGTFYIDTHGCSVWDNPKIPRSFGVSLSRATSYVMDAFEHPSPQRPVILQTCPGYTFLPTEMFNLIQCFEGAHEEGISRIVVMDKNNEPLKFWQGIMPRQKCYFLAPLSSWQYARLKDTKIRKDFRECHIGPEKEKMAVADADIYIFNPQLSRNIRLRAALVRRDDERLAIITNISRCQERYIRRIAEHYFWRWPNKKLKTYYDLLEEAHEEDLRLGKSQEDGMLTLARNYTTKPEDAFRLFLEKVHQRAMLCFFPSRYSKETLNSMIEKCYNHPGYLKIRRNGWEVILQPFREKKVQDEIRQACQKFNQTDLKISPQKYLRISLQEKE